MHPEAYSKSPKLTWSVLDQDKELDVGLQLAVDRETAASWAVCNPSRVPGQCAAKTVGHNVGQSQALFRKQPVLHPVWT